MNRNLDFQYTLHRWFSTHPESEKDPNGSSLQVPLICEFMPSRWAYEAMIVAQAKMNPLTRRQESVQHEIDALVDIKHLSPAQETRLADLKDTLALLSGMEAATPGEVDKGLRRVDRVLQGRPLDAHALESKVGGISAERLYVNQKVTDLVSKAETEQADYRRVDSKGQPVLVNVFFGPEKHLGKARFSIFAANTFALLVFSLASLLGLHESLRRQLRTKK